MTKILLAEDDPDLQALTGKVLKDNGFDVVSVGDGAAAVEAAAGEAFDLVVMDLNMPVLDGFEATRRLKADAATAGIPVVALSVETMTANRDAIYEAGCDAFVNKPVDYDLLLARIAEVLK